MNSMAIMSWECKATELSNLSVRNMFDNLSDTMAETNVLLGWISTVALADVNINWLYVRNKIEPMYGRLDLNLKHDS